MENKVKYKILRVKEWAIIMPNGDFNGTYGGKKRLKLADYFEDCKSVRCLTTYKYPAPKNNT